MGNNEKKPRKDKSPSTGSGQADDRTEEGQEFELCDEFGDEFEEGLEAEAEAFNGDSLVVPVE